VRIQTLFANAAILCLLAQATSAQEIADRGDFILDFQPGSSAVELEIRTYLMRDGGLDLLIQDVNDEINLLQDVLITFAPGPVIAALLNLEAHDTTLAAYKDGRIYVSYAHVVETMELFARFDDFDGSGDQFAERILPNVGETLLHEIGHALIHVNRIAMLPGEDEEVVADQLAFFIVSDFYDAAEDLIPVVNQYRYRQQETENVAAASSPHPPDAARARNYLCWIYGYDPERFGFLTRAIASGVETCEDEYYDLWEAWVERLDPSWKESAEPDPEALFYHLVDEEEHAVDDAAAAVADIYDLAVAIDLAVYLCAPEPDAACEGSVIEQAWAAFLAGIDDGRTVPQVTEALEGEYAADLLTGIAVYWCSPDPDAGCHDGDGVTDAWSAFDTLTERTGPAEALEEMAARWDPFVLDLIGAAVCGHPACYAGEVLPSTPSLVAGAEPLRPSGLKRKATPKRGSSRPERR